MIPLNLNPSNPCLRPPFYMRAEANTPMVAVFKTNVLEEREAKKIRTLLLRTYPSTKVNFDLDDCDKILRIEAKRNITTGVILLLKKAGYECEELED